jgi:hypothetical protein
MHLSTHHYTPDQGWDRALDATLDSASTWVLVFGSSDISDLNPGLDELKKAFPLACWTGCSTSGEIHDEVILDHSLVVAITRFEHTQLRLSSARIEHPDASFGIGEQLGKELAVPDLKTVFVLSDGLNVNGSALIDGLSSALPNRPAIMGGLAGDGDQFRQTWVLQNKQAQTQAITAIGFYGDHLEFSYGSAGGWDLLGPERKITNSTGNVLYSIDGQPALTLYKKYLGDRAAGLPATGLLFPLAILNKDIENEMTVRTILSISETENSITFAGDVPTGSTVRLMRANFERLINGAGEAAASINFRTYRGSPLLNIGISCIGRRLVLGQRSEEEIEEVRHVLPRGSELVGFYSYGEISPLASGECDLHNQTMTLSSFWENE